MFISNGIINGSGHTMMTMVLSLVSLWIFRVPLSVVLTRTSLGITGIWIARRGQLRRDHDREPRLPFLGPMADAGPSREQGPAAHPLTEPWSSAAMIWRWNSTKMTRVGTRIRIVPAHSRGTLVA